MRALILSDDYFEVSELGEPLRQLQAKGVKVDDNLITSRQPADLPAFMREIFRVLQLD